VEIGFLAALDPLFIARAERLFGARDSQDLEPAIQELVAVACTDSGSAV
jgi:hypothetical protein